jgi:hypothetical protein
MVAGKNKEFRQAQWKKGQSGNPRGKAPIPPELKAVQNLTRKELVDTANILIKSSVQDLERLSKDRTLSGLQSIIVSIALRVKRDGDMVAFDRMLDRLIGKVKDEVEFSGSVLNQPQVIIQLPANGREIK